MHVTNLLKQGHKLLGEDVGAQGVCGKVFLQSLLCHLPGVDHAPGIVDQHVQLCVLAAEIVNKLKSNETGFKNTGHCMIWIQMNPSCQRTFFTVQPFN